jgi:hypothetical protein
MNNQQIIEANKKIIEANKKLLAKLSQTRLQLHNISK